MKKVQDGLLIWTGSVNSTTETISTALLEPVTAECVNAHTVTVHF